MDKRWAALKDEQVLNVLWGDRLATWVVKLDLGSAEKSRSGRSGEASEAAVSSSSAVKALRE